MPTEAFFNLDNDRKEKLLEAAVEEFSKLPYSKVSILKIAQNADVSRTGFYYYFKDKKDIYNYLVHQVKNEFLETLDTEAKDIDLFWFCEKIFDYIADIKGSNRAPFFRNMVQNMSPTNLRDFFFNADEQFNETGYSYTMSCDMSEFKINTMEERKELVFMLACALMFSVSGYLDGSMSLDRSKEKMHRMFDICKFGILKK